MANRLGDAACARRGDEHQPETLGVQGLVHRAVGAPGDCGWEEWIVGKRRPRRVIDSLVPD